MELDFSMVKEVLNFYGFPILLLFGAAWGIRRVWAWLKPHGDAVVMKHLTLVDALIANSNMTKDSLETITKSLPVDELGHRKTHESLNQVHGTLGQIRDAVVK